MKSPNQIFHHFQDLEFEANMMDPNPLIQAQTWLSQAEEQEHMIFPNAMTLATIGEDGFPSSRIVLLKKIETKALIFYTNYTSPKAEDMLLHPQVALNLYWPVIERQMRIIGIAEKISWAESESYFSSRERASQIGAWASNQSKPVASREALEKVFQDFENQFEGKEIPCPEDWGGFRVHPISFEFWQLRPARYHDRFKYTRDEQGKWIIQRLFP